MLNVDTLKAIQTSCNTTLAGGLTKSALQNAIAYMKTHPNGWNRHIDVRYHYFYAQDVNGYYEIYPDLTYKKIKEEGCFKLPLYVDDIDKYILHFKLESL